MDATFQKSIDRGGNAVSVSFKYSITINLTESEHATSFNDGATFYKNELTKAVSIVESLVAKLGANNLKDDGPNHTHDAITILGPRGAGKTSFILSLKSKVQENIKELQTLDLLDPTLMEDTETFLVTVTSAILKALVGVNKTNEWNEALQKLCKKFRVLAPKEVQHSLWKDAVHDADSFAYEILMQADSGRELAEAFSLFVRSSANLLNKKAFLLSIDDVDTAFQKGWPVLETLRMYLANPYLITVISGNLDLYEMLCRNEQWSKIKPLVDIENDLEDYPKIVKYREQVDQLTSQYLLKILPPYNRITLAPISHKIWQNARAKRNIIDVASNGPLSDIFSKFSKTYFGLPAAFESGVTCLDPLKWHPAKLIPSNSRRFLRFLRQIIECNVENESGYWLELSEVFRDELYKKGVNVEDIARVGESGGIEWLTRYCLSHSMDTAELWRLDSRYAGEVDEVNNHIGLLLQGALFISWKISPFSVLEYAIKTAYLCYSVDYMVRGKESESTINYLHLNLEERTGDTANRLIAFCHDKTNWQTTGDEYFQLTQKRKKQNLERSMVGFTAEKASEYGNKPWIDALHEFCVKEKSKSKIDVKDVIPSLENFDVAATENARFLLEFFSNRYSSIKSGAKFYVSFIVGMGHLDDLLRAEDEEAANATLRQILQRRTYPVYSEVGDAGIEESDVVSEDIAPIKDEIVVEWAKVLIAWKKTLKVSDILPPPIIARIMVRLKDNFITIKSEVPTRHWSAGFVLRQWVMSFINSILVEECIYRNISRNISLSSVVSKEKTFVDNIRSVFIDDGYKSLPFTYTWMSCPLFQPFIRDIDEVREYLNAELNHLSEDDTFWKASAKVLIPSSVYAQLCSLMATPPQGVTKIIETKKSLDPVWGYIFPPTVEAKPSPETAAVAGPLTELPEGEAEQEQQEQSGTDGDDVKDLF
ncbi:hypothetical protein [Geomesophilobacter sediminis]|uniref:Uncharacterized protein n=1 Tax=Geomesophilobacter sediminis TaxID=2798584 RepID=A0A8J7S791_9BACT|nr:hypothetical protein [Geomesophilobacter sediminis]MBJ6726817.1 hypothetical protein [Geomesophilobacter sediminis]